LSGNVRYESKINHSNEEFNKKNKHKLKRKYKNAVELEYVDIYSKKLPLRREEEVLYHD
jgi:hypothetical protein